MSEEMTGVAMIQSSQQEMLSFKWGAIENNVPVPLNVLARQL
jgi:hypothetical protein